jgi:hypothetical protein
MLAATLTHIVFNPREISKVFNEIWLIHLWWTNPFLFHARPHLARQIFDLHAFRPLRAVYGFSIPDRQTVQALRKVISRRIIEFGSGKG